MNKKPRFITARKPVKKSLPSSAEATVENLSHEMRGIARVNGKAVFIDNALPGEQVKFRYTSRRGRFDEGIAQQVVSASIDRCTPRCPHVEVCGGCSIQQLHPTAQIAEKQKILLDQLSRFGGVKPQDVLPPLTATPYGYRRKARIGIRQAKKSKGSELVFGFRKKHSNDLVDTDQCPVLHPKIAEHIPQLKKLVADSDGRASFSHLEVAVGDRVTALVLRHLSPLCTEDRVRWLAFAKNTGIYLYIQAGDAATIERIWPEQGVAYLSYQLPEFDLTLRFQPLDFVQVNFSINQQMVSRAVQLLDPQPSERILDLFCGLGNFTLPLARRAAEVVGVEGASALTQRGIDNAALNQISNVHFYSADLNENIAGASWALEGFDKILLDPPRSGALAVVRGLARFSASRIVYISCNPATLARDAGELSRLGYRLSQACVMDMFPHTDHVESMAIFEKI
ncbi:23S rRNA (uracil(1939)-C(5))-methyltransferase RlmD [Microbulbifer sp. OS29]|uniref:23S rRNA (uracil(1939)-C(5))-methyltransferase RlmD n=1 Tax=Microbulbifer okhotskensis TaxID=2926617 RepID=A0A9X2EN37_9GAMM|nr:23S rRNA (uracil(1939)-C(5))-methyltransferase RlmD [Microbulbifer okhotskensis]MCO1334630.1 23S rRNA (uracil(1939)-C(5))-methyltransferase RlmD [Microbulbifer okhotskensis]